MDFHRRRLRRLRPRPPSTGAHGGGGLYGQGKDRARIAASFSGSFVTGAAAPWAARIGITLQAPIAVALYRLGPRAAIGAMPLNCSGDCGRRAPAACCLCLKIPS